MAFLDFNISGDTPELIFGEITNIEDDVIELTRYPDFMKLYIDFENKGIPKYLPIIDIKIRDKPSVLTTEPEDIHNFFFIALLQDVPIAGAPTCTVSSAHSSTISPVIFFHICKKPNEPLSGSFDVQHS